MPFATFEDFENWSGEEVALDSQNNVDFLLDYATSIIQNWAEWHISPNQEDTLRLSGKGGNILTLPSKYVTDVSEVAWADRRFAEPLVLDPNFYTWSVDGMIQLMGAYYPWWLEWTPMASAGITGWPETLDSLTVTLEHGYDPVPKELVNACCEMVANSLAQPHGGVSMIQVGSIMVSYDRRRDAVGMLRMEMEQMKSLMRYRL